MSSICGKVISVEIEEESDGKGGSKTITKFVVENENGTREFEHPGELSDQMRDLLQKGFDNQKLNATVEYTKVEVKDENGEAKVKYKVTSVKLSHKKCD